MWVKPCGMRQPASVGGNLRLDRGSDPRAFSVTGPGLPSIPGLGEPQGSSAFQMKTLPLAKWTVCRAK